VTLRALEQPQAQSTEGRPVAPLMPYYDMMQSERSQNRPAWRAVNPQEAQWQRDQTVLAWRNMTQIYAFQYDHACCEKACMHAAVSGRAFDGHLFGSYQHHTLLNEVSGAALIKIPARAVFHQNPRWVRRPDRFRQAATSDGASGRELDDNTRADQRLQRYFVHCWGACQIMRRSIDMCAGMCAHVQRCDVCAAFGNRERRGESYVRISRPHRHSVVYWASYVNECAEHLNHRPRFIRSSSVNSYPASDSRRTRACGVRACGVLQ